ncbi:MAG: zinc ABC transporter substrate-binding protein ZnuA [Rhodospirillales bacterium]|nr:zinc ABC transporter substrate-binding protein ZnuA [Rhodospirillales bacterium]
MKRHVFKFSLLTVFVFAATIGLSTAQSAPKVVASILPIHSLVAAVMDGVGKPTLLLTGNASPHTYSLKPSQARQISQADAVFWIAHDIESFMAKSIDTLAKKDVSVELGETTGLKLLKYRKGGAWEGEGSHDDHEKEHGDKHAGHDDHAGHGHGEHNMHVWLDPQNARIMALAIAQKLKSVDPANAAVYDANAKNVSVRLQALSNKLRDSLIPVKSSPFFVFHDAYQYFEKRYGLNGVGSISVSPERKPGAKRIKELRSKVKSAQVNCIFSEPQFEPAIVKTLIANSKAKAGVLDPLGSGIKPGPNGYFELMENMANAFYRCLAASS